MALLLNFHRRVLYPAVWLDKDRWERRWKRNPEEFRQLLDANAETVLEDLGGFEHLLDRFVWWPGGMELKRCRDCGEELPVIEFRATPSGGPRPECRRCEATARDRTPGEPKRGGRVIPWQLMAGLVILTLAAGSAFAYLFVGLLSEAIRERDWQSMAGLAFLGLLAVGAGLGVWGLADSWKGIVR